MISYQMGWSGKNAGPKAEGKRIRPLLVLLAAEAAGEKWTNLLPAAAGVELIHNFSLIHDDIEDNSDTRRGRPTVWKLWGEAQAINTGDAMFALANISMQKLVETISPPIAQKACALFHRTCLHLTQGQHLDILFEDLDQVSLDDYLRMVSGKTAALLGFCLEVGALAAGVSNKIREQYKNFGINLGLAFQIQDDILGIWGEQEVIGKSIISDLVERKKTLPVLYGINERKEFYNIWTSGSIHPDQASGLAQILENEGALAYAQTTADKYTEQALTALEKANPQPKAGKFLHELAISLLGRNA
jgi:geranylgeranyl diphosphate synthase type I